RRATPSTRPDRPLAGRPSGLREDGDREDHWTRVRSESIPATGIRDIPFGTTDNATHPDRWTPAGRRATAGTGPLRPPPGSIGLGVVGADSRVPPPFPRVYGPEVGKGAGYSRCSSYSCSADFHQEPIVGSLILSFRTIHLDSDAHRASLTRAGA